MSADAHDRNSAEADALAASIFGQNLPEIVGATLGGRFFSKDAQAGRPAIFVALGAGDGEGVGRLLAELDAASGAAAAANVDLVPLAPMDPAILQAVSAAGSARERVVIVSQPGGIERAALDGSPAAFAVDRAGRIVDAFPFRTSADVAACLKRIAGFTGGDAAGTVSRPIPVLVAPNVMAPDCRAALIDLFERSDHVAGRMAAVVDGKPVNKLDAERKSRRDLELTAAEPLHSRVLEVLAGRCAPAVKFAFQREVAFVDRILIARYDVGDHFLRHRDNLAPQTAFREFAVTLNLNTDDYGGGCLRFPEFSDQALAPPPGSAAIFSASLLHEVTPVTRGVRYAVLTFLSSRPGPST